LIDRERAKTLGRVDLGTFRHLQTFSGGQLYQRLQTCSSSTYKCHGAGEAAAAASPV